MDDDGSSSSDGSSTIDVDWSKPAPRMAKDVASPRWSHFLEGAAGPSVNRNKTCGYFYSISIKYIELKPLTGSNAQSVTILFHTEMLYTRRVIISTAKIV